MLAARDAKIEDIKYPVLVSPKMDGCRAIVIDGKIVSRKLERFPNPYVHYLFDSHQLDGVDGELVVGKPTDDQVRNLTSGHLNRKDGEPEFTYHVFDRDAYGDWLPFKARYKGLVVAVDCWRKAGWGDNIQLVEHTLVENDVDLMAFEKDCLDMGYEGVIIRGLENTYKYGRSTLKEGGMLKLKRFVDAEAQVLKINEEMENTNPAERDKLGRTKRSKAKAGLVGKSRAGELEVIGVNGQFKDVEFVVPLGGAGDIGKAEWWVRKGRHLLGTDKTLPVITYRFFPIGVKDKPLLTTYVGIREDWDQ
jgi:DNA ligase-1